MNFEKVMQKGKTKPCQLVVHTSIQIHIHNFRVQGDVAGASLKAT